MTVVHDLERRRPVEFAGGRVAAYKPYKTCVVESVGHACSTKRSRPIFSETPVGVNWLRAFRCVGLESDLTR
jgi:hypothetical protein